MAVLCRDEDFLLQQEELFTLFHKKEEGEELSAPSTKQPSLGWMGVYSEYTTLISTIISMTCNSSVTGDTREEELLTIRFLTVFTEQVIFQSNSNQVQRSLPC